MPEASDLQILITDIPQRISGGNLSTVIRKDHWRVMDYELEKIGRCRGVALNHWKAGRLTIRLGVSGHHRIHLVSRYCTIRLKLTSDRCFSECPAVLTGEEKEGWYHAQEIYWRDADLTGQDLVLDEAPMELLAIRLIRSEPTVEQHQVRWPMVVSHDDGLMFRGLHDSPDDLFERCESTPRDSCVRAVLWMGGFADTALHFTQVGTEFGSTNPVGWEDRVEVAVQNMARYRNWGVNPVDRIVQYVHDRGWELYFYVRHRGWGDVHPISGAWDSRFNLEHPEYRNVSRHGEPVLGQSIAFAEVREHLCRYYAELAGFGPEGVSPCFVRGCPVVMYEQPMVEGFRKEHAEDPRELAEDDPRWLDYCAKVVSDFMRELKQAVGPACRLSPMVHGTRQLNYRFGLDVQTWVQEGLVHDLFIMCHQYDPACDHSQAGPEFLEYDWFQNMPGRESVRLWPMTYIWELFEKEPEVQCAALQSCLDQGADGYGFWDAMADPIDSVANAWDLGKTPRVKYEKLERLIFRPRLIKYNGYLWDRYTPIEGW